ncbi:hypothetical protein SteCoe_12361 [Stentor coeruleus]|uniref:Myb-like DNA-binding domain containing protein n=1 Tax=Stentor coeruleus TaxID=5963 RepID=A0A1R2CAY0_9CILI|nr:hypothetical protein SteCoe_12361 [Stentor coeruleus]
MVKKISEPWTKNEDNLLKDLVSTFGLKKWKLVNKIMGKHCKSWNRSPKQCRDRWINNLDPDITKNTWTDQEELLLFEKHRAYGNKWSTISRYLGGRSGNSIKNHFYSIIRKNIRKYNKKRIYGDKITEDIPELLKKPKFYNLLVRPAKIKPKRAKKIIKPETEEKPKRKSRKPKKIKKQNIKAKRQEQESQEMISLPNIFYDNSDTEVDFSFNLPFNP